ncbi:hypothetical protein BDZ94DRAFT_610006 [Collybia nuda]|uniref:DUF6593 domain-containing protein n=1 Tax=Collybia nuda TaxID=64659 RepID=A0A9P5Y7Z3_9AGAR|nr:hypothetical protein BDZ94DRAFT_610006 [Collybia nuda]
MNLHLSSPSPLNATYSNDAGQVIYKVDTPLKLGREITTIKRVIPNDIADSENDEVDMRDRFGFLGQIEHKAIASSVIKFGGAEIETKDYFRKEGWGSYGRHRVFTGPDDREYKWILGSWASKLVLNDGKKTPIARFRQKSYGIFGRAHSARLEIEPAGEGIMDTILITFVYIEKTRKDREDGMTYS